MIIETNTALYYLDEDNGVLRRYPKGESTSLDHDVAALRRDTMPIPYELIGEVEVGKPAQFLLRIRTDGVVTLRTTTPVTSIEGYRKE